MNFSLGIERNTYTILGICERTGRLGVAIATHSLASGGYCPAVQSNVGVVSSQAFADPRLLPEAMMRLEGRKSAGTCLDELGELDDYFDYRQIGIVDRDGNAAAHTGNQCKVWSGHYIVDGFVSMGNYLVSEDVVQAMAHTTQKHNDLDLEERLLLAIEAGRDVGGQNQPMKERSAALIVYEAESYALVDLRVDLHKDAVSELRRVYEAYKPYIPLYYDLRAKTPDKAPSQDEWIRLLTDKNQRN